MTRTGSKAYPKDRHALTGQEDEPGGSRKTASGPYVWRHWYNTLNAYLAAKSPEYRHRIRVQPLFGTITTAGEWYLAIPAYSAAPEIGWNLIQLFTSTERELQRVYLGVGLPTRKAFYGLDATGPGLVAAKERRGVATLSPFFDLDLKVLQQLVIRAFRRSQFPCYLRFTDTISAHLKRILELPEPARGENRKELYDQVDRIVNDLVANLAFVRGDYCGTCLSKPGSH
jgi:hypothetical protein